MIDPHTATPTNMIPTLYLSISCSW